MLRFSQQIETGSGDDTRDRDQFTEPTFEEFRQFLDTATQPKATLVFTK